MGSVPYTPEAVTSDWLSESTGKDVKDFSLEQIGIGVGILGRLYRVTMNTSDGGSTTAIAKFPTLDEGARTNVVAPLRFYEKEVRFYSEIAKDVPVATPGVYAAEFDQASGDFVLLLEDLCDRRMEDQIAGCAIEDARTAVDALVDLHSKWWEADFPEWLPSYVDPPFPQVIAGMYGQAWPRAQEVFGDHLSPAFKDFGDRYMEIVPWLMDQITAEPRTLCHGDFRLDNLFFANGAAADPPITVLDWQICFKGRGAFDLAYFVSQSLPTDCRREYEQELRERYVKGLSANGIDYPIEQLQREYAITVAYCFIYAVVPAGQIEQTNERMRELILGIFDRAVLAIEDNNALALLP
jgi:aminoglycoside/choline kinase family phosphotransferase